MERPEDANVGFTLWGPEWVTFPNLGYSQDELGGMALNWNNDAATGAVWYTVDRPEATFTATFTPHVDYVECAYTVWPKQGSDVPARLGIGPCQQMKNGVFEGEDADLMSRLWFVSDGNWVNLASCNSGTPRNVLHIQGNESPEMTGAMAESGWKTIQSPRPDNSLIACTSQDGVWVAGTAAEYSTCICSNAGASHRCMHSQGGVPLRKDGPTTLRVNAYLVRGSLDDLRGASTGATSLAGSRSCQLRAAASPEWTCTGCGPACPANTRPCYGACNSRWLGPHPACPLTCGESRRARPSFKPCRVPRRNRLSRYRCWPPKTVTATRLASCP